MPAPEPTVVGVREYAKHRGVTPKAVRKAIQAGRLQESVSYNARNWPRIIREVADVEWEANTRHDKARGRATPSAVAKATEVHEESGDRDGLFGPMDPPGGDRKPAGQVLNLLKAQTVKATYDAQMAKLRFEREVGQLVEADQVQVAHFKMARAVREALEQIPARCADRIAATSDAHAVRQILQAEIRTALEALSDGRGG